ncbi:contractile injection system protein, VgrG/Pvc8 family (plasmid) [Azospirillum sp. HJ39]|uniref:contractile injection system protein, VgrG/Pvc8 family n=1 Tax=Azospirillum sp. HJ39 TaxID=3159496 RepID=UPI003558D00F
MKPAYSIVVDGDDVTSAFQGQLASLTVTDKTGTDSDELEIEVTDPAGRIALPRRGVMVRISIGWGGALVDKGTYEIDEVEHSGPPDVIRIKGRAAQLQGKVKEQREASYHDVTLGRIVSTIADRLELIAAIDPKLAATKVGHIDQTNESDANFLTRLGKTYGATATIKDGRLVFVPAGAGTGAGGQALPSITVARDSTVSHRFTVADRDATTAVEAQWQDTTAGQTKTVVAGDDSGTVTKLKPVYPTEDQAQAAAVAAKTEATRSQREIHLTLAVGRPELVAGGPMTLTGWRAEIDGVGWIIDDVTHTLTEGEGLTTSLTAKG